MNFISQQDADRMLRELIDSGVYLTAWEHGFCASLYRYAGFFTDAQKARIEIIYRKRINDRTDERATD